jgi:hypothetical protein
MRLFLRLIRSRTIIVCGSRLWRRWFSCGRDGRRAPSDRALGTSSSRGEFAKRHLIGEFAKFHSAAEDPIDYACVCENEWHPQRRDNSHNAQRFLG